MYSIKSGGRVDSELLNPLLSCWAVLLRKTRSKVVLFICYRMKSFIVLCLFGLAAVALAKPNGSTYTDRYDNVNLDEILGNRRLLTPYIKCILEEGKCTADGKELKSHIREALEQNCAKCTDAQRSGTRRVLGHLINNEEESWNRLKAKYDPQSKYTVKYELELKKLKQ
ncbi:hypothetical protein SFRURICE_011780 [Spodoptera frugiperda]|nr:hypothetical protein SFRURICE_011780 [Spodoptera frugiperda]